MLDPVKAPIDNDFKVHSDVPSNYLGPRLGTMAHRWHRIKMWLAYQHYHRLIWRYVSQTSNVHFGEIGCGPGYLTRLLEHWFPKTEIVGVDFDREVLARARQQTTRTRFVQGTAETLPFESGTISLLIALHIIEHVAFPERFFKEAARALASDGILILATPNPVGMGARVMGSGWIGWHTDHVSLHSPAEWIEMLAKQGFVSVRSGTTGLSGMPLFRRWPLAFLNYLPLLLFGMFPWRHGEAFVGIFRLNHDAE